MRGDFMPVQRRSDALDPEDEEFFDQFYRTHNQLLFHFANRFVPPNECEDLVQNVLERLIKQCQTIRQISGEPGKLAYYIHAATQSAMVDLIRARGNTDVALYPPEELDTIIEEQSAPGQIPLDDSYWDTQLLKQKLPPRDWLLLEGKYLIGYSDEELAQLYGCARDSVRMALSRAKKRARNILQQSNTEGGTPNA